MENNSQNYHGTVYRSSLGLAIVFCLLCLPLNAAPCSVFGLDHVPSGGAILDPNPLGITVSTDDPTTQFGVRTLLPRRPVTWGTRLLREPLPPGACLAMTAKGTINEVPGQVIVSSQTVALEGEAMVSIDFSALGASSLTIDYLLGKELILREEGVPPDQTVFFVVDPFWDPLLELLERLGIIVCRVSLEWNDVPGGTTVRTPMGNILQVTKIRIAVLGSPASHDGLSDVEITAQGLPAFTIADEWTEISRCRACLPGDLDQDGHVSLPDLCILAQHWMQCTDRTEPACHWTPAPSRPDVHRTISIALSEAIQTAEPGMTRQQFFEKSLPGVDTIGAPDAVHKLIDAIYEILKNL
jgi:hypothetical protein